MKKVGTEVKILVKNLLRVRDREVYSEDETSERRHEESEIDVKRIRKRNVENMRKKHKK